MNTGIQAYAHTRMPLCTHTRIHAYTHACVQRSLPGDWPRPLNDIIYIRKKNLLIISLHHLYSTNYLYLIPLYRNAKVKRNFN